MTTKSTIDEKAHRLMLIHFSQAMSVRDAVSIAKVCGLPGGTIDAIERKDHGLTLLQALEQRMIICNNSDIMNKFCQTLFDIHLDILANMVKDAYRRNKVELTAKQNNPIIRNLPGPGHGGGDVPMDCDPNDVSDAVLSELSGCIGNEWKQIATGHLGLKRYNVDQIEEENKRLRDKVTAAFVMWRGKNAGCADVAKLKEILEVIDDVDGDAIKVLERHCNHVN